MKRILLLFFLFFVRQATAQYVTIPDTNFVAYLQTIVPLAMINNQMDTTSTIITTNTQTIDVSNKKISNLSGIQYFHSLTHLDCSGNSLTNFPPLPNSITNLNCRYNSLPLMCPRPLPNSLDTFICYYSNLIILSTLPPRLIYLDCSGDSLTSLPALPNTLEYLWASSNKLTSLPVLPNSLIYLGCGNNQLTNLPHLPLSLLSLNCAINKFKVIPSLPNTLQVLLCGGNSLQSLPELPSTLQVLGCEEDSLSCLPELSKSLKYLSCGYNQLIGLPKLPNSLRELFCENNNISCFPTFPSSIQPNIFHFQGIGYVELHFVIKGNPFSCLPNYTLANSSNFWVYNYSAIPFLCNDDVSNNCNISCAIGKTQFIQINIYPNPTSDQIFIEANTTDKIIVDLYDINGKYLFSKIISNNSNINVTNLSEGVYTLTIKTVDGVTNKKLVIVR